MGSFKTEALGEFALKGLQQKMPVYAVLPLPETETSTDTLHATG